MTEKQAPAQAATAAPRAAPGAPAKSGGMAKGLIGGLVAGGLLGMLMGNGFGALNGSGILIALLQIALIGGLIWFALRMFRRRPALAPAGAAGMAPFTDSPFRDEQRGGFTAQARPVSVAAASSQSLVITTSDQESFEHLLMEVQDAFGREDYGRLRACTTPEVMSYLAEEMSQNAMKGLRNEVSATELLKAEVAEAWSEGDADFASVAMQYQSIDVMRDRNSGAVMEGDPAHPSHTTEIWTFVRDAHSPWRLSAIQQA